jgi:hypothetical protein
VTAPTPAEVAREHDARREHAATNAIAAMLRITEWNRQMDQVVAVARQAAADGHGIIIDVSNLANRITAVPEPLAARHLAYVFDHDRGSTFTRTIRLTEPKDTP